MERFVPEGSRVVLVVEDHQRIGNAVRLLLLSAGHEVTLVRSGEGVLAYLRDTARS